MCAYDQDMRTTNDILDSIDNRLRVVRKEIETLTAARAALESREQRSTARRGTTATRTSAARQSNGAGGGAPAKVAVEAKPDTSSRVLSTSRRKARATAQPRPRRKTVRSVSVVPPERVESLLSDNGGLTTSALAERTNGDRGQVLTLLRELETAGRIRRTGQRRGTRWHVITDEDRIRERAAELAARRKRTA